MKRAFTAALLLASFASAAEQAPQWLRDAAAMKHAQYDAKVPAVVLLNEESVVVDESGRVITSNRYAVKVLSREGRGSAVARKVYLTGTGKVKELRAWMVYPSGDVKKYGKDETIDLALDDNDVYNETRARVIAAGRDADPGAVFGYESVTEDKSVFTQFEFAFQSQLPSNAARFALQLPAGWRAEGLTFNAAKLEPTLAGSVYSWEMRDLPFLEEEESGPSLTSIAPRLAVSYFPSSDLRTGGRAFREWPEVSQWLTELNDPQAAVSDAISAKVREVTAGASTPMERMRAIARFAQSVKYVSIQTGIGRGGGYRPHAAGEVLQKLYGDCKDKANLMRAMLKASGIESFPVAIYSGDRAYVREEFASPQQFNHAIIAIQVDASVHAAAIAQHPSLGRLLFFDPTDEHTEFGYLPDHEQGSLALVVAGGKGALVRMATGAPSMNRLERKADVSLSETGAISAAVTERAFGAAAFENRRLFRRSTRPDYDKAIERWINRTSRGAVLEKVEPKDSASGEFQLDVKFQAPAYAQSMRNKLMVFRPAIIAHRGPISGTEKKRKHPLVLDAEAFTETVQVALPENFSIDEMPSSVEIESSIGSYSASWKQVDGKLVFTRSLEVKAATLPADRFNEAREFFGRVYGSENDPVVLVRK